MTRDARNRRKPRWGRRNPFGPDDRDHDLDPPGTCAAVWEEKWLRELRRSAAKSLSSDVKEIEATLDQRVLLRGIFGVSSSDPLEAAQELAYNAMESARRSERMVNTCQSLRLDPENPDALRLRAEVKPEPEQRLEVLARAVTLGLARLGDASFFRAERGHLWRIVKARPCLRAMMAYAETLHEAGYVKEALVEWRVLLDVQGFDGLGARHALQAALLEEGRLRPWWSLWDRFDDDTSPSFAWGAVLAHLLAGDRRAAARAHVLARERNAHVPAMLLEPWRMRLVPPVRWRVGSTQEATIVARPAFGAWARHPAAWAWLRERTPEVERPSPEETRFLDSFRPAGGDEPMPTWFPWLFHVGMHLPRPLGHVVRRTGKAAAPWLLEVMGRDDLDGRKAPGRGAAPATAARLLDVIGARRVVEPYIGVLRRARAHREARIWAVHGLMRKGRRAFEPLIKAWAEEARDPRRYHVRSWLVEALAGTRVRDARMRRPLQEVLSRDEGLGARCAEVYGDPEWIPVLSDLLDRHEVGSPSVWTRADSETLDLIDAIVALGGTLTPSQTAKRRRLEAPYRAEAEGGAEPLLPGED